MVDSGTQRFFVEEPTDEQAELEFTGNQAKAMRLTLDEADILVAALTSEFRADRVKAPEVS